MRLRNLISSYQIKVTNPTTHFNIITIIDLEFNDKVK